MFSRSTRLFTACLTLFVLLISVAAPVSALAPTTIPTPKVTKQQALNLITSHFRIPGAPKTVDATLKSGRDGAVWEILYQSPMGTRSVAQVDGTSGKLLDFLLTPFVRRVPATRTTPLANSMDQARAAAWKLLQELYPEESKNLLPVPPSLADQFPHRDTYDMYNFTWVAHQNGVPVIGQFISVQMDKQSLDVTDIEYRLHDRITYAQGPAKVTPEQAVAALARTPGVKLEYVPRRTSPVVDNKPMGVQTWKVDLVYDFWSEYYQTVDAQTGALTEEPAGDALLPVPAAEDSRRTLPAAGTDGWKALAAELLAPPTDAQPVALTLDPMYNDGREYLTFAWQNAKYTGVALVDGANGFIRRADHTFTIPGSPRTGTVESNIARARQAATALVQRYYGPFVKDLALWSDPVGYSRGPELDPGRITYSSGLPWDLTFFFQRQVNGIPVRGDGIQVTVSSLTGEWVSLSGNWTQGLSFPDPKRAITPAAARQKYYEGTSPVLVYYPRTSGTPSPNAASVARLEYWMGRPAAIFGIYAIDALSGERVDLDGMTASAEKALETTLTGHRAEAELRFLLEKILPPTRLAPDAALDRLTALQLLNGAFGWLMSRTLAATPTGKLPAVPYTDIRPYSAEYALVAAGIRDGVLRPEGTRPELEPSRTMTRAEFAVWMARALKLSKPVQPIAANFTDLAALTAEQKDAVTALVASGHLTGQGAFRGGEPLTQADAALLIGRIINLYQRQQ